MKKKKWLALLLSVIMVFSVIPTTVFAQGDGFTPGRTVTYIMSKADNGNKGYLQDYNVSGAANWSSIFTGGQTQVYSKKTVANGEPYCLYEYSEQDGVNINNGGTETAIIIRKTYNEAVPDSEIVAEGKEASPGNITAIAIGGGSIFGQRFFGYSTEPTDPTGKVTCDWYRYGQPLPEDVDVLYVQTISALSVSGIANLARNAAVSINMDSDTAENNPYTSPEAPYVKEYCQGKGGDISLSFQSVFTMDDLVARLLLSRTEELDKGTDNTFITLTADFDDRLEPVVTDGKITVQFTGGFKPYVDGKILTPDGGTGNTYTFEIPVPGDDNVIVVKAVVEGMQVASDPNLSVNDILEMTLSTDMVIPESVAASADEHGLGLENLIKTSGTVDVQARRVGSSYSSKGQVEADPVYADVVKDKHTITYVDNFGDGSKVDEYVCGETPVTHAPEKDEYTFEGWYEDPQFTKEYTPSPLTKDIKVYAKWSSVIRIVPADIIVYMGGEKGYEGTVGEDGSIEGAKTLPIPGFYIQLPDELKKLMNENGDTIEDLILQEKDGTRQWKAESYDGINDTIFKLYPTGTNTDPVRVAFSDGNTTIVIDEFHVGAAVNDIYSMSIYHGKPGQEVKNVEIIYDGISYTVDSSIAGTLYVRGTTKEAQYSHIQKDGTVPQDGKPGITAPEGTVYHINDGEIVVTNTSGIALLFDDIIDTTSTSNDRTAALTDRTDKVLGETENTRHYELKYLDLVDRNNGDAWVMASNDVTVYWPLPEGTTEDTEFTLLHFEDLHRDMSSDQISGEIENCEVTKVEAVIEGDHIKFTIESGGFSPFALVWETADDATDPTTPQTGDSSNMGLWLAVLFLSGGVLCTTLAVNKRRLAKKK